ncbi:MAG: ferredoxin reductase [Mycobacterium sp.]|nr:ferredoxin reductase [Mycobacterium sp.]
MIGRLHRAARVIPGLLTTPLLPEDYLTLINPLWSAREVRGRVVEVRPEARDTATLVIRPGRGFAFDYRPGQYIGIGVLVDGRWRWRSYSLTSVPHTGARIVTVTVKAMPEGFLSTHLVSGLAPGTVVRLAAARGDFVLPDPPPQSILFLTAGSGITPVLAMLRTMTRRNQLAAVGGVDVVHLHSAPTAEDMPFGAELADLARARPGYRLIVRATRTEGRLDVARIGDLVADWRLRQTWGCGPAGLLDDAERLWAAAGLGGRLHTERFAAPIARDGVSGGTVTFAGSGRSVHADGATTLLDAGEQAGVLPPFGCRMGICHTCVVNLVDGRVRDLRTGTEFEPGSRVQTCVTAPVGDCVVDI